MVKPGVKPQIFVKVRSSRGYLGYEYIHARIQLRRDKYRYLVWYEAGKKREFYLGAVKILPLARRSAGAAGLTDVAGAGGRAVGAEKVLSRSESK